MGFPHFLLNKGMLLVVFIAGGLGLGKDSKTSKNLGIREKYISCSKTLNSSVISPKIQRYTKPVCIFYAKLGSWPKAQSLATHLLTGKECYAVCDTGYARTGVYKCESSRWNNRFSWDSKELRRRPQKWFRDIKTELGERISITTQEYTAIYSCFFRAHRFDLKSGKKQTGSFECRSLMFFFRDGYARYVQWPICLPIGEVAQVHGLIPWDPYGLVSKIISVFSWFLAGF